MSDLTAVPIEDLIAELDRRGFDAARRATDPHGHAREILIRANAAIGWRGPTTGGLAFWCDTILDQHLQRGSQAWQEAQAHVIEALEVALENNEEYCARLLELARDVVTRTVKERIAR